jgi:pyruvate dehydrogenase E1 component beta subunit
MARAIPYMQAINEALRQEMRRDRTVVVFGEDNIGGTGCDGTLGNAWGPTKGLHEEFPDRVFDTPITEAAFVGAAVGAAATGLRPVTDLIFADFMSVCFDALLNQAAKLRYMSGGRATAPMVVRAMWGTGMRGAAQHSQSPYALLVHVPGLKVVAPATAHDAKGLMSQAIRDDDPVIFFEHKMLYFVPGEVPEEPYAIPFGQAAVVREGGDCTIVAIGRMVGRALHAAEGLAADGIECEVVDPRTLSPLDDTTIYRSVDKTGRLVVVDEATPRCGMATEIAGRVAQHRFDALRAPVRTVTAPHAPVPFNPHLEDLHAPGPDRIAAAVREIAARTATPART